MNASSQHGPTIGKAILQQHKTNDMFNSISSSSGSTPPLTQSTISTSRSPPQPSTPPSRYTRLSVSRTRYPADLARARDGRLPLHRRGMSQTYEPFEDLLREAGYKETRIFTPEIERVAEENSNGKSKVAGMVNFLSGFIPGSRSSSMKESSPRSSLPPTSPSPSPLSRRRQKEERQLLDDDATPRPSRMRHTGPTTPPSSPPIINHTHKNASYTSIGPSISSKQMPPPPLPLPASLPNHKMHHDPRPSRATAYLRHIASVPDIPDAGVQRSRSAASRSRRRRKSRNDDTRSRYSDNDEDDDFNSVYEGRTRGNGEGEEDTNVPPLPKTWLETVARAVLFGSGATSLRPPDSAGGSRAVSQPHDRLPERQVSPALRQLRQTRSVISRTGSLADAHHRQYHHHNLTRTQSARSVLSARSGRSDRANRSNWNWATATPSPLSGGRAAAHNELLDRPRPTLMSRLDGSSRSRASESELRTARVMCRSAPASRAASPSPNSATYSTQSGSIRSRERRREQASKTDGKGKGKSQTSSKLDSRGKAKLGSRDDEPPSLTRTMVIESDSSEEYGRDSMDSLDMSVNTHLNRSETESAENRYISGWGWDSNLSSTSASALPPTQESPEEYYSDRRNQDGYFPNPYSLSVSITSTSDEGEPEAVESRTGSEEEEDSSENEVNLAKMLQPRPSLQRQGSARSTHSVSSLRSIRSLRKLLSSSNGAGADDSTGIPPVPPLPACYARKTGVDYLTPPPTSDFTSADAAGWPLDGSSQGSNGRYETKSLRGKRASLPSGWTGSVRE